MRLPASYKGYLRLRWRAGVLHLLLWNSPLIALAQLTQKPKRGQDFPAPGPRRGPVVSIKVAAAGQSCHETCGPERCHDSDLIFLNVLWRDLYVYIHITLYKSIFCIYWHTINHYIYVGVLYCVHH